MEKSEMGEGRLDWDVRIVMNLGLVYPWAPDPGVGAGALINRDPEKGGFCNPPCRANSHVKEIKKAAVMDRDLFVLAGAGTNGSKTALRMC